MDYAGAQVAVIHTLTLGMADARDLHAGLEVKTKCNDWIKRRIEKYGFQEGLDFESFSQNGEKPQGGAPSHGYALSLNTAKELASSTTCLWVFG